MPTSCSAYGCSNNNMKEECKSRNVSFHKFPWKNPKLLKAWQGNIHRENFVPTQHSRVCSDHFEPECFSFAKEKKRLTNDAVPTIFSFVKPKSKRPRTSYTVGCSTNQVNLKPDNEDVNMSIADSSEINSDAITQTDVAFGLLIDELQLKNTTIDNLKKELNQHFNPIYMTDAQIKALCGFEKETFFKIFNFLNFLPTEINVECLSIEQQFFMFMLRLKTGITMDFLAYIFKVSKSTASRSFGNIVNIVYLKLKGVPIWPSRNQVDEFMPYNFRIMCPECRVIIDCTEFPIIQPYDVYKQQVTFSHYKNKNTMKALVGIGPSGGIIFISDLWCGSISDKEIFKRTNILEHLEGGDVVLADKGFKIEDELAQIGVGLRQPLFLADKVQFTIEERAENKQVSNLRVHVERAISRIKMFKYFEGSIPYNSLYNFNEVFFIATFFTNFLKPLITVSPIEAED